MSEDVRVWPRVELRGVDLDPMMTELLGEKRASKVRFAYGSVPAWVLTRYEDVRSVTSDARFSRAAAWHVDSTRITELRAPIKGDMTYQDGAAHARVRRQMAKAFTPARTEALALAAERVCETLVDSLLRQGPPADLVDDLASPFALETAWGMVGVPAADREGPLRDCFETVFSSGADPQRVHDAQEALRRLFQGLVSAARGRGAAGGSGEDLITVLTEPAGGLSDEEIVANAYKSMQSAWRGIRNHSANLLYVLLTHPAETAWLRAHPEAWPAAVDELVRFVPRLAGCGVERIATEDVDIAGVTVRRGEPVYVSYASANRDERAFPDPHRLDLRRAGNPHLAYGHGPHRCPASSIAHRELGTLVGAFVSRLPTARPAVPEDRLEWRTTDILRGPRHLPVTW
ncbi:biflaviolin synthase CYP158A1 [Streptomyces ruber]|uniref:Biflaviolin synthase CYP158A1 n=2 Tax=Streptomyces TaxID=1883 RepID=A0A918EXR4_9ACTN|nr:cytochrome P450 [Streptomyces ruber]GGQ88087.1 biflaviolin synthase CYP158A1 [Streptomyces ruber]